MIFDVLLIYNFLFLLPTVHILVNGMNQGISAVIIQVRRKTTAEFVETSVTNSSVFLKTTLTQTFTLNIASGHASVRRECWNVELSRTRKSKTQSNEQLNHGTQLALLRPMLTIKDWWGYTVTQENCRQTRTGTKMASLNCSTSLCRRSCD